MRQRTRVERRPWPQWQGCDASDKKGGKSEGNETPEDDALQSDLRAKVNELFGGRHNVTIDMNTDSEVNFKVDRRSASFVSRSPSSRAVNALRSPWYIVSSILVVSLVTGVFFTALYYSGAVHGFDTSDDGHYEMPSYGTDSYIDPYELLQRDREFHDSKPHS